MGATGASLIKMAASEPFRRRPLFLHRSPPPLSANLTDGDGSEGEATAADRRLGGRRRRSGCRGPGRRRPNPLGALHPPPVDYHKSVPRRRAQSQGGSLRTCRRRLIAVPARIFMPGRPTSINSTPPWVTDRPTSRQQWQAELRIWTGWQPHKPCMPTPLPSLAFLGRRFVGFVLYVPRAGKAALASPGGPSRRRRPATPAEPQIRPPEGGLFPNRRRPKAARLSPAGDD